MKRNLSITRVIWVAWALLFSATYVYAGNQVVEDIADYGSAGLQSIQVDMNHDLISYRCFESYASFPWK